MTVNQPLILSEEPRAEYIAIDEDGSTALDEVFNLLFEIIDKNQSKK